MSVWKRNAVVLAIVMFVGVAVYLNWSYNNQLTGENSGDNGDGKVLGQTTLVNGVEEESEGETVDGQVDDSDASGYFASARLNRQQARDSALELLQEWWTRPTPPSRPWRSTPSPRPRWRIWSRPRAMGTACASSARTGSTWWCPPRSRG